MIPIRWFVSSFAVALAAGLFLTGCQSSCDYGVECPRAGYYRPSYTAWTPPSPALAPAPLATAQQPDLVWQPDRVGAYAVGRTVDPRDANVVHEAHTIYRREETSRPNLTPPIATATPPPSALAATNVGALLRDALTAELNQQRATSQALTQEARALNDRLSLLTAQAQDVQGSLQESVRLRAQMAAITNRLEAIETQIRSIPTTPATPASTRR